MQELELAGVIEGAESPLLAGLTPTPHDIARAVIAAGWVSPEEHAEYVAMEGRFSELLCDLTDGLLSKTNYDVRAMVQQVEATFQKYADEDIEDARAEAWDSAVKRVRECHAECTDECDLCIARDEVLSDLRTNPYRPDPT